MTREQRCELAIERGFTYDSKTGFIYNRYGKTSRPNKLSGYNEMCVTVNKNHLKSKDINLRGIIPMERWQIC